jgi:transposase
LPCILLHEKQIEQQAARIEKLEARVRHRDARIEKDAADLQAAQDAKQKLAAKKSASKAALKAKDAEIAALTAKLQQFESVAASNRSSKKRSRQGKLLKRIICTVVVHFFFCVHEQCIMGSVLLQAAVWLQHKLSECLHRQPSGSAHMLSVQ